MKNFLCILFVLTILFGYSQNEANSLKKWSAKAKVITLKGDTFPGLLKFDFPNDMAVYAITFKYDITGYIRKYDPKDIKGFIKDDKYYAGVPFQRKNNLLFVNINGDGPLFMLKIRKCHQSAGGYLLSGAVGANITVPNCYYEISYYQVGSIAKKVFKDGGETQLSQNRIKEYFESEIGFLKALDKSVVSLKNYSAVADFYNTWLAKQNKAIEEEFDFEEE